ncbi:hypothetical protein PUNSTDRAFT_140446 [Punctularia strigosozonata HHB-11173 SS5]|uniref:uncharacterized protein n=1 Tax=Punctularia strigosozonata (strain HHB-11173) TaxID=741275 RepID=UPI000441759E|nr:uncharacterized protein PUNSTDRAFT_140446 [Punctularia strigosozonata HHB-11173 SS5]EIN14062.1 hypothetical protein PUNSTDRAFT_140446 [Punctularia strigosozonata HHB-11173 SS5]
MTGSSSPDPISFSLVPATNDNSIAALPPPSGLSQEAPRRWIFSGVELPTLPPQEKAKYRGPTRTPVEAFEGRDQPEYIIDEDRDDGVLSYHVLHGDETVHRYPAKKMTLLYPKLVNEYLAKKASGSLTRFNAYSDTSSRGTRAKRRNPTSQRQSNGRWSLSQSSSEGQSLSESEIDSGDNFLDFHGDLPSRRNTRNASNKKTLPFSPKKTRATRVYAVPDSDFDDDSDATAPRYQVTLRTSASSKRSSRTEDGTDEEELNSAYQEPRLHLRKQIPKPARPAYGCVRPVEALDYDSDEDTARLRAHRDTCEKCRERPAHVQLLRKKRGKRARQDEFEEDEEEHINSLGGWVRCLRCPVAAHWNCLASTQRSDILKAARERDQALPLGSRGDMTRRNDLDVLETTEFVCGACTRGGFCIGCLERVDSPCVSQQEHSPGSKASVGGGPDGDVKMANDAKQDDLHQKELLFRCLTCKRPAHYIHLPAPPEGAHDDPVSYALYYQRETKWLCHDCSSFTFALDKILAWRPYPVNALQPPADSSNYKSQLPREYLVKWVDRSYRRTSWVPHMWLLSTSPAKLKNFLAGGTKVKLLDEPVPENAMQPSNVPPDDNLATVESISRDSSVPGVPEDSSLNTATTALIDAERRIPPSWKTVDRVLEVLLWAPEKRLQKAKAPRGKGSTASASVSNDYVAELSSELEQQRFAAYNQGEQPDDDLAETVEEWEKRNKRELRDDDAHLVIWAFIKWGDLGYEESTWDSPPCPNDADYPAFEVAFRRFVSAREIKVVKKRDLPDNRTKNEYKKKYALVEGQQPDLGQDDTLKLMPFQLDGLNWLCNNWWNLQHCILADEMGLGKTVQIATFLGTLVERWKVFPALVVVPNSTLTNWMREFERWAPKLRVVPFYGEAKARAVIREFELRDSRNYHVLVTTYETLNNPKDFSSVFKGAGRWEVLVVDEGQRLKSDSSLIFKKLRELKSIHRVLMTGTPLNNNMRELFNLMNFLDPTEWHDLAGLEREYAELNENLVRQLHEKLRPYFLRRMKSEVLPLPPKNEVIVPVSMAPLQKEIYRSILSQNLDLLRSLTQGSNPNTSASGLRANMNNLLMQLRKCLQHPYLVSDDIEPRGLSPAETHEKLIDASAKLRLLRSLLPKLWARGHRILLFSQFSIALDIVEDFLTGEGVKYLRLDGNTKQADRQKSMDEFNKEGSIYSIFLLTTRAGGVGINLWSADTVIVFDPDFNPHQDLQAIARAYRYGQKKTCLVFKLMVKDSAEERIMQTGKKKLVLDHLIVQKMDDEENGGDDVQSILTFGAKALFDGSSEEQEARNIHYSDQDIDRLIEKTEKEGDEQEVDKMSGLQFSFAKVWAADKDELEEIADAVNEEPAEQGDSWAQTLQRIAEEKAQASDTVVTGRRRRAAALAAQQQLSVAVPPPKVTAVQKAKAPSVASDEGSEFAGSATPNDDTESETDEPLDPAELAPHMKGKAALPVERMQEDDVCGLCGLQHDVGGCYMTESSENLAEYRHIILVHAVDEPLEERRAAIRAIEEVLYRRGAIHLIRGQPLHLLEPQSAVDFRRTADGLHSNPTDPQPRGIAPSAVPTKRTSSPPAEAARKKFKQECAVCNSTQGHLIKDCPVVQQGPQSVSKQIKRLDQLPGHSHTVQVLRKILSKQIKRREIASSPSGAIEVIE